MLARDDEEDEEIESENEHCAFLDDETEEQEDISFYRRLNVELDSERRQERKQQQDELALYEDVLFGQEQTRHNKVLNGLEEKLNVYLNELPMPGFNSGKYDLNAVKKFLFPYLIETQPINVHSANKQQSCVSRQIFSSSWAFRTMLCQDSAMTSL